MRPIDVLREYNATHDSIVGIPACTYDSGSALGNVPLCTDPATHIVTYHNGSYGPFHEPVCDRHLSPMLGRVYPGHDSTVRIG